MSIFFYRLSGIEEVVAEFILRKLGLLNEVLYSHERDEEDPYDVVVTRTYDLSGKRGTEEHGVYRVIVGRSYFDQEDYDYALNYEHVALVLVHHQEIVEHHFLQGKDRVHEGHLVDELYARPIFDQSQALAFRSGGSIPAPVHASLSRDARMIGDEVRAQRAKREANRRNRQAARQALRQAYDWDDMVIESRRADRVS